MQIFSRYGRKCKQIAFWVHRSSGRLPIVRWSDREHLFVRKEYKVSGRLRELLKQKLSALHASCTVRVCQLLCTAPLETFQMQVIRNTVDWWIPVSRDISRTVLWVCSLSSWLRTKSLTVSTFSSVRALLDLPLTGRLSTVPVSRTFFNSLLTPRVVQLFSGNSSINLFAQYPLKCKLFIKLLSSWLNTMLIVDKHCSDVSVMWRISGATN